MRARLACITFLAVATSIPGAAAQNDLPHIERRGSVSQLIVDNKPYIVLGGELHNSSASSPEYMLPIWNRLAAFNVNTVITPITWQLLEPQEGKFDFRLVDEQLKQARARKMHLVLLWFGAFKNARSTYAPSWVRSDNNRFPRAQLHQSKAAAARGAIPLSVFGKALQESDAKAFVQLMDHLQKVDPVHTVIAVQVENESGVLGDSKDRSPLAEAIWRSTVPMKLISYLKLHRGHLQPSLEALWASNGYRETGSWPEVFGTDWQAEEIFMAWNFATYVDHVASSGQEKLPLPMYANAWLGPQKPTDVAGIYPSGGPIPRVYDIWKAAAPHLDWLSPDIYADNFEEWAAAYRKSDNPLFIPEAKINVSNLFLALGEHKAMAFSPFGFEDNQPGNETAQAYEALSGLEPVVAETQATGHIVGLALRSGESKVATLDDYVVTARTLADALRARYIDVGVDVGAQIPAQKPLTTPQTNTSTPSPTTSVSPVSYGLIMMLGRDDFLVIGKGLDFKFTRRDMPSNEAEIDSIEEGRFTKGHWIAGRTLNGDELIMPMAMDKIGTIRIRLVRPVH